MSLPFSTFYFSFLFLRVAYILSTLQWWCDGPVYSVCIKAMRSRNPWSSTHSEAASLSYLFTLPSRFGRGLARPTISPSYIKLSVKPSAGLSVGFVGWQEMAPLRTKGCTRTLNVFRLICILPNVFYEWRHPQARMSSRLNVVVQLF